MMEGNNTHTHQQTSREIPWWKNQNSRGYAHNNKITNAYKWKYEGLMRRDARNKTKIDDINKFTTFYII